MYGNLPGRNKSDSDSVEENPLRTKDMILNGKRDSFNGMLGYHTESDFQSL